ncbi:hypothetical protein [Pseudonocardia sp. NPDC049154]|uniref:hypothetical protein n=1 Tax=Pseudonocardia sp. NPDC049154 TaxID=3155501 RepID=UPI0033F184FF
MQLPPPGGNYRPSMLPGAPGLVAAAAALLAFIAIQAKIAHPMVPLGLFGSRTVRVAVTIGFAFMIGFYGCPLCSASTSSKSGGCPRRWPEWRSCR